MFTRIYINNLISIETEIKHRENKIVLIAANQISFEDAITMMRDDDDDEYERTFEVVQELFELALKANGISVKALNHIEASAPFYVEPNK
jgi:hypothetical protein